MLSVNLLCVAERAGLAAHVGRWCVVPSRPLLTGCLQGVLCMISALSPGGKKPRCCSAADATAWPPGLASREHGGGIMGGEGHPGLWEGPGSVLVGRVGGR